MKIKCIYSELSLWFKQVLHSKNFWIFLPGLIAVLLVYVDNYYNMSPQYTNRLCNEGFAPLLVLIVFMILLTKSLISRDPLVMYLTVLALVFFVRELNDTFFTVFGRAYQFKSRTLVDFLMVGMVVWAFGWHKKIFACLNRSIILKTLLFGVLWSYFFSQLIARRVFRDIFPSERFLHVPLEETAETAAHLFFLVCALFILFCYGTRKSLKSVATEIEPTIDNPV